MDFIRRVSPNIFDFASSSLIHAHEIAKLVDTFICTR